MFLTLFSVVIMSCDMLMPEQCSKLTVIKQQLDGKLKLLSDMEEEIMDLSELELLLQRLVN